MEKIPIPTIKAKRHFVLSNAGKELFKSERSPEELEIGFDILRSYVWSLSEKNIDSLIGNDDDIRLHRYNSFDWYYGNIPLSEIGPWPKMRGLDIRLTTGNILDTARNIQKIREKRKTLDYSSSKEEEACEKNFAEFLKTSDSMRDHVDFVYERFPIILLPGGEVREKDYNDWARKNSEPLCMIFGFDLDNGNDRAVSYALEGMDSVNCIFSSYRK